MTPAPLLKDFPNLDETVSPEMEEAQRANREREATPSQPTAEQRLAADLLADHARVNARPDSNGVDIGTVPLVKACDPATCLHLTVVGVHKTGSQYIYRTASRDGTYVGRTNPTKVRAVKGDVLHVAPNMFKQAASGDFSWVNPNVNGRADGRAHSRRQLLDLAGLHKDAVPAAADGGEAATPKQIDQVPLGPTGPTAGQVHVNRPLKTISVFYGNKQRELKVLKATQVGRGSQMKQLVYGVVLEPNTVDTQSDWVPEEHVELAAHRYLAKSILGRTSVHRIQHGALGFNKTSPKLVPVESFIAPVDFSYDGSEVVKKGSWVLGAKVLDAKLWADIQAGKYTGWSVGGTGQRHDLTQPVIGKDAGGMHDPLFREYPAPPVSPAQTAYYKFSLNPKTGAQAIWPVAADGNPHHPLATRGTDFQGHVYLDGGYHIHEDRPTDVEMAMRQPMFDRHRQMVEGWTKEFLRKEPFVTGERPDGKEPPPAPEPDEPYAITKAEIDEAFRAEERQMLRRLIESVAKIADKPPPEITVTPEINVAAPEVHIENRLPVQKTRSIRAETLPDGSRRFITEE